MRGDSLRVVPASARAALAGLLALALPVTAGAAGGVDSFNPNVGPDTLQPAFIANVYALALQPDGKILIAGDFNTVGGISRPGLARLNADGSVDTSFNPGANGSGSVFAILVQQDGKIVVGGVGTYNLVTGLYDNSLVRLNTDGSLDTGFNANANWGVRCLAQQPDGKIVVGGVFTAIGGQPRSKLARLNPDGSADAFNPVVNPVGIVYAIALQADGKIVIGGDFDQVGGVARARLARVHASGALDATFDAPANNTVYNVAVQSDGKVLVAGAFTTVNGTTRNRIARLDAVTGALDGFDPNVSFTVDSLALQADGKILLAGGFATVSSTIRDSLARLNANGSLDTGFDAGDIGGGIVRGMAVQADGKVLIVGGRFTAVGGTARNGMARLLNDAATQTLSLTSPTRVEWLRGGASPEAHDVIFELSTDAGSTWATLGAGTRIAGGWEAVGVVLPAAGLLRGRAFTAGGWYGGSGGIVQEQISFSGLTIPEIGVSGNGVSIADGDVTPGAADHTDFGSMQLNSSPVVRTFTISNTGNRTLTLGTAYTTGTHGGEFSFAAYPASTVAPGGSTTFQVAFNPTDLGLRSATVNVPSDDFDERLFDFAIQGTALPSTNATLSALSLHIFGFPVSITPSFASYTLSYWADGDLGGVEVVPTKTEANASIQVRVNGGSYQSVLSGNSSGMLVLNPGTNTLEVRVTAQAGNTLTYTVTVNSSTAFAGGTDTSFSASANAAVRAIAVQPDGKVLIGGEFTTVNGTERYYIARLYADGSLDTDFNPDPNSSVTGIVVQPDGKILIAGEFTTLAGGTTRTRVARLNADGTVDSGFADAQANASVFALALQADGKVLIGGDFTAVGGATRTRLARLNANGTLDTGFDQSADDTVYSVATQADGKVLIGGAFTMVGSDPRSRIARLATNGSVDPAFAPTPNDTVRSMLVQPDGKILIGGLFNQVSFSFRPRLARLNADGTVDSFSASSDQQVFSIALQADGKILLGANSNLSYPAVRRFESAGSNDDSFDAFLSSGSVYSIALQANGQVLVGGEFAGKIARLTNGAAPQSLTATSFTRVEWLRGGTSSETTDASFDVSTDGGTTWSSLGAGTRISGGWERTGLALPGSGIVRARGRTIGGIHSSSGGIVETSMAVSGLPLPDVSVSGNGVNIADGDATPSAADHTDFGSANIVGATVVRTFTIANAGTVSLTLGNVSVTGTHAADFTVTSQPASPIAAGASTTFQVSFDPGAVGVRSATLSFGSDDFDEAPFDFAVQGTGIASSNADLAALTLSSGSLAPAFVSGTTSYTAGIVYQLASLTVTPTKADANATIQVRVNGGGFQSVASGSPSGSLAMNVGANTVDVKVTAQDGSTKTYSVTVTRAAPVAGDADTDFDPGANGNVYGVAVQPDGKLVVVGTFATIAGGTRNRIARLNADGTLDSGFNPNANGDISGVAVQADGKIVVAGGFTQIGGQARNFVARLNPDGTADSFNPNANAYLYGVALQPDGKILLAGTFTSIGGEARNRVARMNADGTLDTGFDPNANDWVSSVVVQEDGKVLLAGAFTTMKGSTRNRIARMNAEGTLDTGFDPNANAAVLAMAQQADGRILVGGDFTTLAGGTTRNRVARLNAGGSLDSFNPGADGSVYSIALQADGKILVSGLFTQLAGTARNRIARLLANGTLDSAFNPDANNWVLGTTLQGDGEIVIAGAFTSVGVFARNRIARLENGAVTQSFSVPNFTRLQWLRGGTAPETQHVTFDVSSDGGSNWTALGSGTRIGGGWEKTGLVLPGSGLIRARARTTGGEYGVAGGLVQYVAPYAISTNADLSALTVSTGALAPAFASATTSYTSSVGYYTTSSTVTATTVEADATIQVRINGGGYQAVASGTPSASLALNVGPNPVDVRVTAPDGTTTKTYTVTVTRTAPVAGDVDTAFDPGASAALWRIGTAVQPDGKILVGGGFTTLGGAARNHLGRLQADGTLDMGFDPNVTPYQEFVGVDSVVQTMALQADGKILVGGPFQAVSGVQRLGLARLHAGGTVDVPFLGQAFGLEAIEVQPDGKILLGGFFNIVGWPGFPAPLNLVRLEADGSRDLSFALPLPNHYVLSMAMQTDGKILLGGLFTNVGGVPRNRIARVNADGTLDTGFDPGAGADNDVYAVAVQADGKILIAGIFGTVGGVPRTALARLNADGSLDAAFNAALIPGFGYSVSSLAVQADGKILVGGNFTRVGNVLRNNIARLNADGTPDVSFNPNANDRVFTTALQADGEVLLGGRFTAVGPLARSRLARLENGPATQSLTVPSFDRVQWLRGGTSPETQHVSFELSTNGGSTWTPLGTGTRISGGWEKTGLGLPASGQVRARARVGQGSSSSGLVETVASFSGLAVPEVGVAGNGVGIADGDSTPSTADHTDFGGANLAGVTVVRTFTIANGGPLNLAVGNVTVGGAHASDFSVTTQPPASVVAGGSTTFQVTFDPSAPGLRSATLSFATNDGDENPFDFAVQGTGTAFSNADLSALTLSTGALAPAFAPGTTSYTANVAYSPLFTVTPTKAETNATIQVRLNGGGYQSQASGSPSPALPLNVGANTVDVKVTAQDLTTTRTYTVTVTRAAPVAGDVDRDFAPNPNAFLYGSAVQPDGKLVIAGGFTQIGGVTRNRIARLNADGTLDATFDPNANGDVNGVVVQADGKIVLTGGFTQVGGVTRNRIARVNADGTLDMAFDPNVNGYIRVLAQQPDGKLLIGGSFTMVGAFDIWRMARLNADGTPELGFGPTPTNGEVAAIVVQPDGMIVFGGTFTDLSFGLARNRISRLHPDGQIEFLFNPNANGGVFSLALQPDGKILVGGAFTTMGGSPRSGLARLNGDGSLDAFNPGADNNVYTLAPQADGKVLAGGFFTQVAGTGRNRIARLLANGTLDSGFNPNANDWVLGAMLQADGEAVLAGTFTSVGGLTRNRLARVENDAATQSLSVSSFARVQWLRGGTSPEAIYVTFELSTNGGTTWTSLGTGTRIAGGWEKTGLGLPASGQIRARARTAGGEYNSFGGLVEAVTSFSGLALPEVAVSGNGVNIADGDATPSAADHTDFGSTESNGGTVVRTFTISNGGTVSLAAGNVAVSGAHAADFVVTAQPASQVAAGGSATFQVTFDPSVSGLRSATLSFASDDFDETPFDFAVQGTGALSNNADLVALTLSSGTLAPAFAAGTTSYTAGVAYTVASMTVTPTKAEANATIQVRVNGGSYQGVASGSPSSALALNVGPNAVDVMVTAEDATTAKTYSVTVTRTAPVAGDVDLDFNPNAGEQVHALAVQPDGKIILAGGFTTMGGLSRTYVARVNADGTLDTSFAASLNQFVGGVAVQPDGKIVLAGSFTQVGGVTRQRIARVNADGTLDTSFSANANSSVNAVAVQPDGKIVLVGNFTTVGGTTRNRIARVNADGSLDPLFNPGADNAVTSLALQPDGKIVIGGAFTTVASVARNRIARLNADGSLDTDFDPGAGADFLVHAVAVQADGKILLGGQFVSVAGVQRYKIARLAANGALDGFNPDPDNDVYSLAVQADGKIVAGGAFTWILNPGPVQRNSVARFNADGTLDAGFNLNLAPAQSVLAVALQADGELLLGGAFTSVGGLARNRVARLENGYAAGTLSATSFTRVDWLRGGTSPETHSVAFELSTDAGASWTPLGAGTRVVGGWERTGLVLPASGRIRARASTSGGRNNGSSGLLETVVDYSDLALPEVAVSGNGVNITDGDATPSAADHSDFGGTNVAGGTVVRTFTIHNSGAATLSVGNVTLGGTHAADFTVTTQPSSPIAAGGSTTFEVTFDPSATGTRSATLSFTSDDADETPFDFTIQGSGGMPEIAVNGNGVSIADGDATPSAVDHTDFGSVATAGGTQVRTFTVLNTGSESLTLDNVGVSGPDAADFTVTAQPASPVAAGGSTMFQVSFDPSALGLRSATLSFTNGDGDENPFDFAIQGTGVVPEVTLSGNSVDIVDGDATPSAADHTDFGSVSVAGGTVVRTFTVANTGSGPLTLGSVSVTGTHAADFSVTAQPASPIAAGGSTTFQVTFDPSAAGLRSATLSFTNDDADENPFDFAIQGSGGAAPTVASPTSASITSSSAVLGGDVTSDGGSAISARGVVAAATAANPDPVLGGAGVIHLPGTGTTGAFTVPATGLAAATQYSFKAYATNGAGTSYTPVATFTTLLATTPPGPSRVFVSVSGQDVNDCSNIATPCRTLNAALAQVAEEGEVIVTRSGSYAGATVTKSVKLHAASGVVAFSGLPITVNAGSGARVVIRGLTLKALNPGTGNGLLVQSAGAVIVENSVIDGWDAGIRQQGAAEVFVKDSVIRNNTTGLLAEAGATSVDNARFTNNGTGVSAAAEVSLRGSTVSGNATAGIRADAGSSVGVEKCQLANNGSGIMALSSSSVRLSRSVVGGNGVGLDNAGGMLVVYGNNVVRGNSLDTSGTITPAGLQ